MADFSVDNHSSKLLPKYSIHHIRYFTAMVKSRPGNPNAPQRQQTYLRALKAAIPNLTIQLGTFISSQVPMHVVKPPPSTILVHKTEEKGSDVNLATALLVDAFDRDCEIAAVVSNDTDLITPITIVQTRFQLPVIVFNPHLNTSWPMRNAASEYRQIRKGALAASQLPPTLRDSVGEIHKPAGW